MSRLCSWRRRPAPAWPTPWCLDWFTDSRGKRSAHTSHGPSAGPQCHLDPRASRSVTPSLFLTAGASVFCQVLCPQALDVPVTLRRSPSSPSPPPPGPLTQPCPALSPPARTTTPLREGCSTPHHAHIQQEEGGAVPHARSLGCLSGSTCCRSPGLHASLIHAGHAQGGGGSCGTTVFIIGVAYSYRQTISTLLKSECVCVCCGCVSGMLRACVCESRSLDTL